MKRLLVPLTLALILTSPLMAQEMYQDSYGAFSYRLPEGWSLIDYPGLKFRVAIGQTVDNFTQNITAADEASSLSLDDYVQASLDTLDRILPSYSALSADPFFTDGGLEGRRLVIENAQMGYRLLQYLYIFSQNGSYIVLTCTTLYDHGDEARELFDRMAASFTFGAQ